MILPSKHITINESLLGLGAYILRFIKKDPQTIDQIWKKVKILNSKDSFGAYHGIDNLILALNYLYLIGAIDVNENQQIYNAVTGTKG